MSKKLSKKDLKLLSHLDLHGRASYSDIARNIKVSKQVARYKVARLEREQFILGYYPLVDHSTLGLSTYRIYMNFQNTPPALRSKIIRSLKEIDQLWAIVRISGKWDLALGVSVVSKEVFYRVWTKILSCCQPHLRDYTVQLYEPVYYFPKGYICDEPTKDIFLTAGNSAVVAIDDIDISILKELSLNARTPALEIARKLNLAAELLLRRIKRLEKTGVIKAYRALVSTEQLGYVNYKAEIRLVNYGVLGSVIEYCKNHPNIYQVEKTIGGEMIDVEFHVRGLHHFHELIDQFQEHFDVQFFDYITVISEEKMNYMPVLS